jgi:hypothetical protein
LFAVTTPAAQVRDTFAPIVPVSAPVAILTTLPTGLAEPGVRIATG